jgi:GNAT superfamily N-acetyltransferase
VDLWGGDAWDCNCGSARCLGRVPGSFYKLPLERQIELMPRLDEWFIRDHPVEYEALRRAAASLSHEDRAAWRIRPAKADDGESIQQIAAANPAHHFEGLDSWQSRTSQYPDLSLLAEVAGGPSGWILAWPDSHDDASRLRVSLMTYGDTDPNLSHALLESLETAALTTGALQLRARANSQETALLALLADHGFQEHHRMIFSRLVLSEADVDRAEAALARAESLGYDFVDAPVTGAEEPDFWKRLSDVHNAVLLTMPQYYDDDPQGQFSVPEVQAFIGGGQFPELHGRIFLARRGGDIAGYSTVYHQGASLHQGLTGVDPPHRSRGLALALKALIIRYAKQRGAEFIDTGNRSDNPPILELNRSLGFVQERAELRLWKQLQRQAPA